MTNPAFTDAPVQEVGQQEMLVALSGPALLANRFFINISPNGVRIAFAEQDGPQAAVFRSAVILSFQDAYSLSSVIKQLLDANVKMIPMPVPDQPEVPQGG
jgi:hypothetical protein